MQILLWISIISGGLLVLMLVLSIISGLDFDFDLDFGDADIDVDADIDAGGLSIIKGILTFLSIGSYVVRLVLFTSTNPILAFIIGAIAGIIAVFILSMFLKFLLSQQENVNWSIDDALFSEGTVYLKIPKDGEGIVRVMVNGVPRQFKAKSNHYEDIATGTKIIVEEIQGNHLIVRLK